MRVFRAAINNLTFPPTILPPSTTPHQTFTRQIISMHRTSARQAPLDFLLPSNPTYGIDRRKDIGLLHPLPQLTPGFFEATIKDGLRTPPADGMGTTYQYQNVQYNNYPGRQDATGGASMGSHAGSYTGPNMQGRQYSKIGQLPPASTSTLQNEIQAPSSAYNTQPSSPQPAHRETTLAPPEDGLSRRRSANNDMIQPNLQIPASINSSGGSLAEFAAQVRKHISVFPRTYS